MLADKTKINYFWSVSQSQNDIECLKDNIRGFLDRELEPDEIDYYSTYISKILACRNNEVQNQSRKAKDRIANKNIEFKVVEMTEGEIKHFILVSNSTFFSPFEYTELSNKVMQKLNEEEEKRKEEKKQKQIQLAI